MNNQHVGNPDELTEDLYRLFIYCFTQNNFFEIEDIISRDMFNLLTSWKQPLWDLFPREIENSLEWYIDEEQLHLINKQGYTVIEELYNDSDPDMLKFPVKVKITILEE